MKSLMSLWSCAATEWAARCCTSATPDIKYVRCRFEHEGLWFLAVTLADFGKSFQQWLDQGFVASSPVPGFALERIQGRDTGLPKFLSGFLKRVFDPSSGVLLENPDIETIRAIRQLTLMFSKIALPGPTPTKGKAQSLSTQKVVGDEEERAAMLEYLQCENEVRENDERIDPSFLEDLYRMSNLLFGDVFAKVERDVQFGRLVPKHGPGVVADRLSSNAKWDQRTWTTRLQRVMPAEEFLLPNFHEIWKEERSEFDFVEPGSEKPVRVISVPKTLKAPRIIAIEPAVMQYAQQALFRAILSAIEEDGFLYRTVGFDDQEPNRALARSGSHYGGLATLDLSEASDRVSNQHVLAMLQDFPHLSAAVQASRSTKADVPGHGIIPLAKFASMGSALCFPMEAMVFTTLIFLGIERELSTVLSREDIIKMFSGQVRVFGDDLIVPRDYVLSVVDELSTFGYKVNIGKSYWTGRFRESCGREYYDGHDVSIVKVRRVLPTRRQDASGVISAVELRNHLYWDGQWQAAKWLDNYLEKLLQHFPNVGPDSPLLGRQSCLGYRWDKIDHNHHGPLTKGWYVVAKPPQDHLEGVGAMLKCLIRKAPVLTGIPRQVEVASDIVLPEVDSEHLERSGRPKHVSIKLGWKVPY